MPTTHSTLWDQILDTVESRRPDLLRGWFPTLQLAGVNHGTITIRARNIVQREYLETHCAAAFTEAAQENTGRLLGVAFEVVEAVSEPPANPFDLPIPNPAYTFENFATGPCNRLAHAALTAFTRKENDLYRTIYLHGPEGSGKTHLLHAAANAIRAASPNSTLVCLSADVFASQLIRAMERQELEGFRTALNGVDIILLDDIDELANRPLAQEEFFRIFNAGHAAGQSILISGNAPPSALTGLEDRLRTRLAAGFVASMDSPCLETRTQIVTKLAERLGYSLEKEAAAIIAESSVGTAPELERILHNADRWSKACGGSIPPDLASSIASRSCATDLPTPDLILREVAKEFQLSMDSLCDSESKHKVKGPRGVAAFLAVRLTDADTGEIGHRLGFRTDAAVRRNIDSIEDRLRTDPSFRKKVTNIVVRLAGISPHHAQAAVETCS